MTGSDKRVREPVKTRAPEPLKERVLEPLQARVLEELSAMDIAPDVAAALAARTPQRTNLEDPSHIPLALLVKHLPVVDDLASVSGGIMAVVGPTGAGKTTTIAKLAARWCMQHGIADLGLVSTDGYRIGARDQLHDLRAHSRRPDACGEQRQGAGAGAGAAQIQETDSDRHRRHGTARRAARRAAGRAEARRRGRAGFCWRCRRRAKAKRSRKSCKPSHRQSRSPAS